MGYVNVDASDNNGNGYRFSIQVAEDNAIAVVKTIANKACLVVDAWGYGEYSDMYRDRMSMIEGGMKNNNWVQLGFACLMTMMDISITDEPTYEPWDIVEGLHEWDVVLLEGYDYDPDTDPYDLNDILPELGVEKFEYQ